MVSGMPSIVNIDENNICSIIMENCAPYDVTLERDDIIEVMETEPDELVPLTDDHLISLPRYTQPLSKSEEEKIIQG